MRPLRIFMFSESQFRTLHTQTFVPIQTLTFPIAKPFVSLCLIRSNKKLKFHLFKFPRTVSEVSGCNFISEGFSNLGNSEWDFNASGTYHIFKIDKSTLSNFSTQINLGLFSFNYSKISFYQKIKFFRRCPFDILVFMGLLMLFDFLGFISSKTYMANQTLNKMVCEGIYMA